MTQATLASRPAWIATEATVTSCRYQFRAGSALGFGVQLGEKFRITFDYYVHGKLYSDQFQSPIAIAQNERIPLLYNPRQPEENTLSRRASAPSGHLPSSLIPGVVGSGLLLLIWLAYLRGCH